MKANEIENLNQKLEDLEGKFNEQKADIAMKEE